MDNSVELKEKLRMYAPYIIETVRIRLGYSQDDSSHDDKVLAWLEGGKKISKSDYINNPSEDT